MRAYAAVLALVFVVSGLGLVGVGSSAFGRHAAAGPSAAPSALEAGALALSPAVPAKASWTLLNPATHPSNRDQVQMAYDPALKEVVLFGGYLPSVAAVGDTWTFHAGTWTDLTPNLTKSPPARWGAAFVWDPAAKALILFGGRSTSQFFNDTWKFNATGWHKLSTPVAPSPRNHMAAAYDAIDHYVLVFGGGMGNAPVGSGSPWSYDNDTWAFSAGHWKNLTGSVTGAPPPSYSKDAAFDPVDDAVVLQGGSAVIAGSLVPTGTTYTYAAGAYHNVTAKRNPGPLYAPMMSWDPRLGKAVIIGENTTTTLDPTFGFRGGVWTNLTPVSSASPATRGNVGLAYDAADGYLVLFGGDTPPPNYAYRSDTWTFS